MYSQRTQIQFIADRLVGRPYPPEIQAAHFQEPWRSCWLALEAVDPPDYPVALLQALAPFPEPDRILQIIQSATPGEVPQFPSYFEKMNFIPEIRWLWPNWIPLGMITILAAAQGSGKSFVALDLAYRIIHNLPFPDGSPSLPAEGQPYRVIYVDAEFQPQLLKKRVGYYHLNSRQLFVIDSPSAEMVDLGEPKYKELLLEMVYHLKPILVIIDSFSSVQTRGQNQVEDVRELLDFMTKIAFHHQVAILVITHIRKPIFGTNMLKHNIHLEEVIGSSHITRVARVVMGMNILQTGPEFDENGPRQVKMLKSNVEIFQKPLSFVFQPVEGGGVVLKWSNSVPAVYRQPSKVEECRQWLLNFLEQAGGPVLPKEILQEAASLGFSRRTVYRAREQCGNQVQTLPGQNLSERKWEYHPHLPGGNGAAGLPSNGLPSQADRQEAENDHPAGL